MEVAMKKSWLLSLAIAPLVIWFVQVNLAQTETRPILIERPPLRFIKDPNPGFSTVAVNSEHNMLVVGDENLFQVMEYDRRDNTPPQARFTEPKRSIGG